MSIIIKQGELKGIVTQSILTGKEFYSFLGIPYAKPPIGDLRFKAPQAHGGWTGILNATTEGNDCQQRDHRTRQIVGDEDCLYLNVYTSQLPSGTSPKKAVMVFIHGGGFQNGTGGRSYHGADYLINHDIILVTINYRCNIFGFLNLGLAECPGNVGLKDQLQALKWVNDNIGAFGGDAQNITLFGESAGAASVHYHMISPNSEGLFHKAILQSGNALNGWAFLESTEEINKQLAISVGLSEPYNNMELYNILRSLNAKELLEKSEQAVSSILENLPRVELFFVPSKEKIKDGAFLLESPRELIKKAKPAPVITGVNDKEGLISIIMMGLERMITNIDKFLPRLLGYAFNDPRLPLQELSNKIKEFYFEDKPNDQSTTTSVIVDIISDIDFVRNLYSSVSYIISQSSCPAYIYKFSFDGSMNYIKQILYKNVKDMPLIDGACHADDVGYLFYGTINPEPVFKEPEVTVIQNICKLWTNFAKTSDPCIDTNISWPAVNMESSYLVIDEFFSKKIGNVFEERINFWKTLMETYHIQR